MKTNCPMKLLLQELTDLYFPKGQDSRRECCAILVMKFISETHDPLELIEAIRKEFEKHNLSVGLAGYAFIPSGTFLKGLIMAGGIFLNWPKIGIAFSLGIRYYRSGK